MRRNGAKETSMHSAAALSINSALTVNFMMLSASQTRALSKIQMDKNNLVHNNLHVCISSPDYLPLPLGVKQAMKFQQDNRLIKDASNVEPTACHAA